MSDILKDLNNVAKLIPFGCDPSGYMMILTAKVMSMKEQITESEINNDGRDELYARIDELEDKLDRLCTLQLRDEYEDDDGCVIWWSADPDPPIHIGTPHDSDWPDEFDEIIVYWTPIPNPKGLTL